ncbi:hypothetical protein [Halothiobacillus sp. DCM-1]|uniref:hypothetical protein n=1 Tax=Halothiobacillus sp. DCM-1 TaxID=3112558 RepID=UPI00325223C1
MAGGPAPVSVLRLAARACAEDATLDHAAALRKAAARLQLALDPRFTTVDHERLTAEIRQYQLVFRQEQSAALRHLREEALRAMAFFAAFSPRLVGAVLAGTADRQSTVTLHLFADPPEAVLHFLYEKEIPFRESERQYHYRGGRTQRATVVSTVAFDVPFDLVLFAVSAIREAPLGAGGAVIPRASAAKLAELLADEADKT